MRRIYLASTILAVGTMAGLAVGWATSQHDIVVRQRAAVEWAALIQISQTLHAGHQPYSSDVAAFLSNRAVEQALKQLVGATVMPPVATYGDVKVVVKDVGLRPDIGLAGVVIKLEISSKQRNITLDVAVDGNLAFRGVRTRIIENNRPMAAADFALSILSAEPHLKWGGLDISGHRFVSELVSTGLMRALDKNLVVSVPFEDRLSVNTAVSVRSTVPTDAGSVTFNMTMPGKELEQRFDLASPLFLRTGVWLIANTAAGGQSALRPPAAPNLPTDKLAKENAALRDSIAQATKDLEQKRDFVLWVKGSALVGLADKLKTLPVENRTLTFQSVATTGQLVSDGKSYAELSNPGAATAHLVIGAPDARWIANHGVSVSLDANADLAASVHAHANPLPVGGGAGTTVGLNGGAAKRVTADMKLTHQTIAGHSVLVLGMDVPCDSVEAELKTDGKLVIGPMKTDVISVGMRWSVPLPPSLVQPTVVLDDTPHRMPLLKSDTKPGAVLVTLPHPAVEVTTRVSDATANQDGYLISADLNLRPADSDQSTAEETAQRDAISQAIAASSQAAAAACHPAMNMRLTLGGMELGPNGFLWQTFANVFSDVTNGPGPNNEGIRILNNAQHDLTHGPGPNNEVVKVFRRLGF